MSAIPIRATCASWSKSTWRWDSTSTRPPVLQAGLNSVGISSTLVKKPKEAKEGEETTISLLEEGKISYVISTSKTGRQPGRDSVRLRRKAVELGIPCLTSLDTAAVLALTLESQYNEDNVELVDIAHIAHGAAARKELSQMEKPEEIQIPGYVLQEHEND